MSAKPNEPKQGTGASTPNPDDPKTKLELVSGEKKERHPFDPSPSRLKMIEYAGALEKKEEDQDVGFSARLFAQVSLPQRNPGDLSYFERRNGNVILTISPGLVRQKDGSRLRKYPYGLYPRLALTYIATEAVRTDSPTVDLGRSMRSFLENIGVDYNGRNAKMVHDQLAALFGANLTVEGLTIDESGHGTETEYFQIADRSKLWWANKEDEGQEGLWSSSMTLTDKFFRSIKNAPVPVDLKALRALGGSSFRIDLYMWATYRVYYLRRSTKISWADLSIQFGAQYGRLRAFKAAFIRELEAVTIVYPALRTDVTSSHLIIHPSLTHVPSNKPRRELASRTTAA